MKTFTEIEHWTTGAMLQFGDPAKPVGHAFFRYVGDVDDLRREDDLVFSAQGRDLKLLFGHGEIVHVQLSGHEQSEFDGEQLAAFGAEPVTAGLWALTPSLNIPQQIHVFVTLYDVPTPAPWVKSIVELVG